MIHVVPPPVLTIIREFKLELLDVLVSSRIALKNDAVNRVDFTEIDLKPLTVVFVGCKLEKIDKKCDINGLIILKSIKTVC